MGRKNKETGQSSMFDHTGKPLIDYGTTEKDIEGILKSIPPKKIIEPTANKLVEVFQKPEIPEKIDSSNEIISVSVPFVFYDTGVVDAIFTRKKYSPKSCIEFYFHVLDGDSGYKRFSKRLEDIEKFFSRFFGWDGDKKYLRENMGFKKNRTDKSTIEGRAKQDRTNQFMKVVEKIKGISYDRGYVYTGDSRFTKDGLSENKDKFINYPHDERKIRLEKRINGEEYDYPSPEANIMEGMNEIVKGKIITEIKISRDASFDEEDGLHGKVPFYFLNTGLVDHNKTMGEYTLKDCIIFYLKVVRKESHYGERFSKLLPNIKKYFTDFWKWDGNIETLEKYLELTSKISRDCQDEIMVSLAGGLDVERMHNSFGEKKIINIIDDILKSKHPFDDILLLVLLNKFLVSIKATDEIDLIEQNKENLIKFFSGIIDALKDNGIGDKIYEFGENMWQSYEKILDIIFYSFDKIRGQDENKYELTRNDNFDFDDWFGERYPFYLESVKKTVWQLLGSFEYGFIREIKKLDFIVPMFASYMKKGENAEIVDVYKRNLIKRHLKGGGKKFIDKQEIKLSKQTNGGKDSYDQVFPEDNNFTFDKFGNRIWEEKDLFPFGTPEVGISENNIEYLGYGNNIPMEEFMFTSDFDEFGNEIFEDEEVDTIERLTKNYKIDRRKGSVEPVEKLDTINRLVKMLADDGLLEKFLVNVDHEYVVDKTTGLFLDFEEIFAEDENFWKIKILERASEHGGNDESNLDVDGNPYEQEDGTQYDDDLPF